MCALDHKQRNALWYGCRNGCADSVGILLAHNAVALKDEDGLDALDVCLEGGSTAACAKLVLNDPALVLRLVHAATVDTYAEDAVSGSLVAFAASGASAAQAALLSLAEVSATTGQKLLCASEDADTTGAAFVRSCRVLVATVTGLMKSPSIQSATTLSTTNSKDQMMRQLCDGALESMRPAWGALEEWLRLIAEETEAAVGADKGDTGDKGTGCTGRRQAGSSAGTAGPRPASGSAPAGEAPAGQGAGAAGAAAGVGAPKAKEAKAATEDGTVLGLVGDRVATAIYGYALITSRVESLDITNKEDYAVPPGLFEFTSRHAPVIRAIITTDPEIIFGRFSFVLSHLCLHRMFAELVRAQPFELRQTWFHEQLHRWVEQTAPPSSHEPRVLTVSRKEIFNTSCRAFADLDASEGSAANALKAPFQVQFEGEAGIGAGVKREWISMLSREVCFRAAAPL